MMLAATSMDAQAEFVSYVANIATSTGNPVTDLLILEEDTGGLVHASVLGDQLPGYGKGNWVINSLDENFLPGQTSGNRAAFVIDETAQTDLGPFGIQLALDRATTLGVDKLVLNDTGEDWQKFVLELGTTVDGEFVPWRDNDGLGFVDSANFPFGEETGAFPNVLVQEDRIVFSGWLDDGQAAPFVTFIDSATVGSHTLTLRQYAVVPEPTSLAILAIGGLVLTVRRRREA